MSFNLFISYSHADMEDEDWLGRLKKFLKPLERSKVAVDIWDDSRIAPGQQWSQEIDDALKSAHAAILLIGPGFLASDFVMKHELPLLLEAAKTGGTKVLPIVVGYCGYMLSETKSYQACNDPEHPLEELIKPKQNEILNKVVTEVYKVTQEVAVESIGEKRSRGDLRMAMKEIGRNLKETRTAFVAQCRRRDDLRTTMLDRLGIRSNLEYEKFFFRYYHQLNDSEKFEFDQIRAITEGPLENGNRTILEILDSNPQLLEEVPTLIALRQHLAFWLSKHDLVFSTNKAMCVLYVGVEDGLPFPSDVDKAVSTWLGQQ
ncbi:toll/interleukin-1 receptor domain-containing protein [Candidatus Pacearchaeota archaeon]|nr:toll/interleukin-1 receptor domain-containing protein [Candidatus Pacearchaeota archaeon]